MSPLHAGTAAERPLVLEALRTTPTAGVARFRLQRTEASGSQLIAYSSSSGGGQIGVYDISAKKARIVSRGSGLESPSWTRNSRHLVASQNGHLVVLDTLTGETTKVPNNLSNNTEPNTSR